MIEAGYEVILSHGNGPQVGMIQLAMEEFSFNNPQYPVVPLSMCVAMSQSYIGYDLENALQEELRQRNISKAVTTVVTQVVVDENDPAFKTNETNWSLHDKRRSRTISQRKNIQVMEDAGRGYRQVVASPKPKNIVELLTIQTLVDAGQTVIAGGGGGIPVIQEGNRLKVSMQSSTKIFVVNDWLNKWMLICS